MQKTAYLHFCRPISTVILKTSLDIRKIAQTNAIVLFITFPMIYICLYLSTVLAPKNGKNWQKMPLFWRFSHMIAGTKNEKNYMLL